MSKLIIKNNSHLNDRAALTYIQTVVEGGRVSGDGYCLCTVWSTVVVYASVTKSGTDVFRVEDRDG